MNATATSESRTGECLRRTAVALVLCVLPACAWTTEGRGPVLWLSYRALAPDPHALPQPKPWDYRDEYPPGQRPVASIDPTIAGILLGPPALVLDLAVLPITAAWGALGGPWDQPANDRRQGR